MKKISIAFDATATPSELTGAGYYVKELLHRLDIHNDISLKIITRKNDKARFKEFAPSSEVLNISPDGKSSRIFFQTLKLGPIVDQLDVDIFHGPHYQIPKNMKTKSVVTIHDMTLLTHKDVHTRLKKQFFSRIIPLSIKNSKSVITVSDNTATDMRRMFKNHGEIFVAPLGVDTDRFKPEKDKDEHAQLAVRGISGKYIGFLGHFEPRKSVPTLIEAFSRLHKQFPDLNLVLAGGKGWGSKEIRESIVNSGVATKIITPGRLDHDEIAPFLRQSEVFVYPSLYEGFGMPVLEAMSCGTPTITTNSSSLKEVAKDGALMFEPKDVDGLVAQLTLLISDAGFAAALSKKAIARSKEFTWEHCAEMHLEAYRHAAKSGGPTLQSGQNALES